MQTLWLNQTHLVFSLWWCNNWNNAACDFLLEMPSCSGDNIDSTGAVGLLWPTHGVKLGTLKPPALSYQAIWLQGTEDHRTHHWKEFAPLLLNSGSFKVHNISIWNIIVTLLNWLTALAIVLERRENKETYKQKYAGGEVKTQSWLLYDWQKIEFIIELLHPKLDYFGLFFLWASASKCFCKHSSY